MWSYIRFTEQSAFVQLQQKLILKVGVADMIKNFITMNLRKQLASAEILYNKLSLQKCVGKIMTSLDYQLKT